ncbi:MAG TPA: ABC transporter ATP-binding protein [Actinobacteria bacterium]|nr:ABC transporter ATP-binding protein [Actinomycetota bacterium]
MDRGEVLALLGPSGCGKTTLLRVVAGLEAPEDGRLVVDGELLVGPGTFVPPERRRIGMVFQDWALFPHLTVAKNVAFGLERGESERVAAALEMVGLAGLADRYPDELSGGQRQRVALARALAPRPRVVLFDEPFSNLDAALRARVRAEVVALVREVGTTAIFVTHDQEEAFALGDRVAVMREGRILQVGTPTELYRRPVSPWVATFVGEANLLPGAARGEVVETLVGPLPLADPLEGSCRVVVRPEHLEIGNGYLGLVTGVEFYGHDTSYRVAVGDATVSVRSIAAPRFGIGDRVALTYVGPPVVAYPAPAEVAA